MIRHDLHCPGCDYESLDALVRPDNFGDCPNCGSKLRWTPTTAPATDVAGGTQEDHTGILTDPAGRNLTWSSSRERDRKMYEAYGVRPVGDKVGGARNEYSPLGKTITHFGSRGNRSQKRGQGHE